MDNPLYSTTGKPIYGILGTPVYADVLPVYLSLSIAYTAAPQWGKVSFSSPPYWSWVSSASECFLLYFGTSQSFYTSTETGAGSVGLVHAFAQYWFFYPSTYSNTLEPVPAPPTAPSSEFVRHYTSASQLSDWVLSLKIAGKADTNQNYTVGSDPMESDPYAWNPIGSSVTITLTAKLGDGIVVSTATATKTIVNGISSSDPLTSYTSIALAYNATTKTVSIT